MGLPWQGDTAYCRSGYELSYDPYFPTFWPARAPNHVLAEDDYAIVMDTGKSREERLAAFGRRASWDRFIDEAPNIPERMKRMIASFGAQGVVEARPGFGDDADFPKVIYVETLPESRKQALRAAATLAGAPEPLGPTDLWLQRSGWGTGSISSKRGTCAAGAIDPLRRRHSRRGSGGSGRGSAPSPQRGIRCTLRPRNGGRRPVASGGERGD